MAQPGSASALGAEGRQFESGRPDQDLEWKKTRHRLYGAVGNHGFGKEIGPASFLGEGRGQGRLTEYEDRGMSLNGAYITRNLLTTH